MDKYEKKYEKAMDDKWEPKMKHVYMQQMKDIAKNERKYVETSGSKATSENTERIERTLHTMQKNLSYKPRRFNFYT